MASCLRPFKKIKNEKSERTQIYEVSELREFTTRDSFGGWQDLGFNEF